MSKIRLSIFFILITISITTTISLNAFSQTVTDNKTSNSPILSDAVNGNTSGITIIDAVGDIE